MPQPKRDVVKFAPNVPVEVALKYALPGRIISTQNGERMMFTLSDDRVMFLDLNIAKKVNELGVNVREKFFVCRPPQDGKKNSEWKVWLSPETENIRSTGHAAQAAESQPEMEAPAEEVSPLERKLRESIELVKQGRLGELGNGMFAVQAGASAGTPAPVLADAHTNGHHAGNNGNGNINGKNGHSNGNGNGARKLPEPSEPPVWAQSLLDQANALVDVYAAALSSASTKHGNQVKPEDVRSLLVTVFIQRSKVGTYGA
jgi:hypothetical protein